MKEDLIEKAKRELIELEKQVDIRKRIIKALTALEEIRNDPKEMKKIEKMLKA